MSTPDTETEPQQAPAEVAAAEKKQKKEPQRRADGFGIVALASALLSGLLGDKLSQSLDSGGWIAIAGFCITGICLSIWLIANASVALATLRTWRSSAAPPAATELHALAEEAEKHLVSLGSDAGGMAAAEWFEDNEERLRHLFDEKPQAEFADDIARICDALDAWYVRKRAADDLLTMSEYLAAMADSSGRRELAELAAVRAATAYRLKGKLKSASTWLGISNNLAPHTRTAAALTTRRHVERALSYLARAETAAAGSDREEAVLIARDRLDDARLSRPGPDLAGDVAIQINLAIVHLYQQDPESARDQLRPAAARARAAGDVSSRAHALELTGVAAWMQGNKQEAQQWWEHAEHLYTEIEEREGRARCLQHLGSALVLEGKAGKARPLLEKSASLRGGVPDDYPVLMKYLAAAHDGEVPVVIDEPRHRAAANWLRRLIVRLRS